MRGRVIGLGLLGLGAFLLAAAVALPAVLVPSMVRLPLDQKADVVVTDDHATYIDLSKLAETQGPVTAHLRVQARLAGGTGDQMVAAEAVYSSERALLVEPVSGKIVRSVEKPVIVLRGPDGTEGAHVLAATLGPDAAALKKSAADAADTRDQI